MARYLKRFTRIGSAGPTEERGFEIWAGYEIDATAVDLTGSGLINVDAWSEEQLLERGVRTFTEVAPDDDSMHRKLGIRRRA